MWFLVRDWVGIRKGGQRTRRAIIVGAIAMALSFPLLLIPIDDDRNVALWLAAIDPLVMTSNQMMVRIASTVLILPLLAGLVVGVAAWFLMGSTSARGDN